MPSQDEYRRRHNIHLITQLIGNPHNVSPFTLALDSLEQPAKPLTKEYIKRANNEKTRVIFVAFETFRKPEGVDVFLEGWKSTPSALHKSISSQITQKTPNTKTILIIDTLNHLASAGVDLSSYLPSLITPRCSLLAVWHLDVPVFSPAQTSPYSPHPLTLLKFLSTTLFQMHSFNHVLAQKAARDKSLASPVFGLNEEVEGIIIGLQGQNAKDEKGFVLEMEHRRKSGRAIKELYFLPFSTTPASRTPEKSTQKEKAILLEDHPLFRRPSEEPAATSDEMDTTFSLSLTEKQRRDREGIVLPYHDAQKGEGGEGGRILYEMGVEDDFDEEEDEI